jgi:hypothetical protein
VQFVCESFFFEESGFFLGVDEYPPPPPPPTRIEPTSVASADFLRGFNFSFDWSHLWVFRFARENSKTVVTQLRQAPQGPS